MSLSCCLGEAWISLVLGTFWRGFEVHDTGSWLLRLGAPQSNDSHRWLANGHRYKSISFSDMAAVLGNSDEAFFGF